MKSALRVLSVLTLGLIHISVLHGADPLTQWGPRTAPGTGYALNTVAFGNGVFVAVGGNGTILVSADGVNWTNSSPGNYGELRNVRFLNGAFNVVGNTNRLLRSPDGVSWTEFTLPLGNYWDVAYGNNVYLVVGKAPFDETFVSEDSVNWSIAAPRVRLAIDPFGPPRVVRFDCLVFGAGKFIAMPRDTISAEERGTFQSTDGTNWVKVDGPYKPGSIVNPTPSDMVYANGLYLIANHELAPNNVVYSSSNGVSWTAAYLVNFEGRPSGMAFGANYFVATRGPDDIGGSAVFSSTNATAWQRCFPFIGGSLSFAPRGVAFGNGTFVVVGTANSNPVIYQSGNVSGAPTILVEPLDRAAVVGNPASFSVLANGADPLAYQWHRNGSPVSGATNATFSITNVVAGDGGAYHVIVTNSFGSVTSRVAQLTVSFLNINQYAGITILGVPGKTYRIEAAPEAGGSWTTLTNLVLPKTPFIWIDYDSPSVGARVYRAAELQ